MQMYAAMDLHSQNNYMAIIDEDGRKIFTRKLPNEHGAILGALNQHKESIVGVVVESTFNWYWVADMLMDEEYRVHLANPSAIQKYSGLKNLSDKHDALWLAEMLRLGVLPEGYIYPKEERPVRDLLRRRSYFVKQRTSLILSLKGMISRNYGVSMKSNDIKVITEDRVSSYFDGDEESALAGRASKEVIDLMTEKIKEIERRVVGKVKLRDEYRNLLTMPAIGQVLGVTIMLETGPISRFKEVGNYASYCRKVPSEWTSNGKVKGKGNRKNGNKYLAWAYSEAAELAKRYDPRAKAYYNRKKAKTNRMVAHNALAHKLARAAYYVMRDQVAFDSVKLFGE